MNKQTIVSKRYKNTNSRTQKASGKTHWRHSTKNQQTISTLRKSQKRDSGDFL